MKYKEIEFQWIVIDTILDYCDNEIDCECMSILEDLSRLDLIMYDFVQVLEEEMLFI